PIVEAAEAVGIAGVSQHAALEEVHLESSSGVRGQLKLGSGQARSGKRAWKLIVREEEVENGGRVQRCLGEAQSRAGIGRIQDVSAPLNQDIARARDGWSNQRKDSGTVQGIVVD